MTDVLTLHSASSILKALCKTITHSIHPLSRSALTATGTKLFGAAILLKSDLSLVHADTNQEAASPLWHGETYCISQFFATIPASKRPNPKDCIFLTTHEPCSLCINAICWSGFDNFVYMWTYEETDELFGIPGDLMFWDKCFYDDGLRPTEGGARQASLDGTVKQRRPEYRLRNDVFVATSFAELMTAAIKEDEVDGKECVELVERTKRSYGAMNGVFREKMGITEEEAK